MHSEAGIHLHPGFGFWPLLPSHMTPVRFPGLLSSVFLPSEKGRNITNICGCQISNQVCRVEDEACGTWW